MNYNQINLDNYNVDKPFVNFLTLYQNQYVNKVLNTVGKLSRKNNSTIKSITTIIEDFFLSPKYDNVLDIIKFKK